MWQDKYQKVCNDQVAENKASVEMGTEYKGI